MSSFMAAASLRRRDFIFAVFPIFSFSVMLRFLSRSLVESAHQEPRFEQHFFKNV